MTINQGGYGADTSYGDYVQPPEAQTKTVYDLPPGSPPYSTRDEDGNVTNHEPRGPDTPQGHFDDTQRKGGKNDPRNIKAKVKNSGLVFGGEMSKLPSYPPEDNGLRGMVEGFVKDTFEDDDTGRLEAGRAIAASRSVAGRGQGSASGGMLAHAADVSMSAADRAQEKMFGRKLAVSGIAEKIEKADLELSKMDENTRRNALAAIIMAAAGGMAAEDVQKIIEAYESGDSQAHALIGQLWPPKDKKKGNGDDSDGGNALSSGSGNPWAAGTRNYGTTPHGTQKVLSDDGTVAEDQNEELEPQNKEGKNPLEAFWDDITSLFD